MVEYQLTEDTILFISVYLLTYLSAPCWNELSMCCLLAQIGSQSQPTHWLETRLWVYEEKIGSCHNCTQSIPFNYTLCWIHRQNTLWLDLSQHIGLSILLLVILIKIGWTYGEGVHWANQQARATLRKWRECFNLEDKLLTHDMVSGPAVPFMIVIQQSYWISTLTNDDLFP